MRAALEMICGHTCRIGAGSAEPNLKDQSEEEARVRQRAAESRPQSFSAASHESENRRDLFNSFHVMPHGGCSSRERVPWKPTSQAFDGSIFWQSTSVRTELQSA